VRAAELAIDGGASLNDWLAQFQADILGLPVRRPSMVETTALGAAGLAGISAGVWRNAAEFLAARDEPACFQPAMSEDQRGELMEGWRRAINAAVVWADDAAR
jgi:glycerol kinase